MSFTDRVIILQLKMYPDIFGFDVRIFSRIASNYKSAVEVGIIGIGISIPGTIGIQKMMVEFVSLPAVLIRVWKLIQLLDLELMFLLKELKKVLHILAAMVLT